MEIILASSSPRRKELLELLDIDFKVIPSKYNEQIDKDKPIQEEIEKLSFNKALDVFNDNKDSLVIGADTVVVLNNKVLGKPKNKEDAFKMLSSLSNRTHQVVTAVTIMTANKTETFTSITSVTFDTLSEKEINDYIETKEPLDKAGSYAIQGKASKFIKSIDGDYYTVVGLPINKLYEKLKNYIDK